VIAARGPVTGISCQSAGLGIVVRAREGGRLMGRQGRGILIGGAVAVRRGNTVIVVFARPVPFRGPDRRRIESRSLGFGDWPSIYLFNRVHYQSEETGGQEGRKYEQRHALDLVGRRVKVELSPLVPAGDDKGKDGEDEDTASDRTANDDAEPGTGAQSSATASGARLT
jgi:hypothetical protein